MEHRSANGNGNIPKIFTFTGDQQQMKSMNVADILYKYNNNLDLIRILLASLVIVGHSPYLNGADGFWVDPVGYFFSFTYSGALAVKLFFFISGLVVTNSYLVKRDAVYFIISRSFRIIPALLAVLMVAVFVLGPMVTSLPVPDYFSNPGIFEYFRRNLVFATSYFLPGVFEDNIYRAAVNGSLWSLRYEMGCYIVLLAGFVLLQKRSKYWLNIPIVLLMADAFFPFGLAYRFLGENTEINLLPFSFALGAFFAVNAPKIRITVFSGIAGFALAIGFRFTAFAEIALVAGCCLLLVFISANKQFLRLRPKHDISYGIIFGAFWCSKR